MSLILATAVSLRFQAITSVVGAVLDALHQRRHLIQNNTKEPLIFSSLTVLACYLADTSAAKAKDLTKAQSGLYVPDPWKKSHV